MAEQNHQDGVSALFNSDDFTAIIQSHDWRQADNQSSEPVDDELQQLIDTQERLRKALERLSRATNATKQPERQVSPDIPVTRLNAHRFAKAESEMAIGRQMIREAMAKLPQR